MYYERTQFAKEDSIGEITWQPLGDPPPTTVPVGPLHYISRGFQSLYEIKSEDSGSRYTWNPFAHFKSERWENPYIARVRLDTAISEWGWPWDRHKWWWRVTFPQLDAWRSDTFGPPDSPFFGLPAMYSIVGSEVVIPPPAELSSLLDDAARHLLPKMKNNVSIINSIYELKDFRRYAQRMSQLRQISNQGKLKPAIKRLRKRLGRIPSLRDLARVPSGLWLEYNFNLAQLYSDSMGFVKALQTVDRRVARLFAQAGQRRTRHHQVSLYGGQNLYEDGDPMPVNLSSEVGNVGYATSHRVVEYEPVTFHVEMQYTYEYSDFQKRHKNLLGLLDALGINNNAGIIWNALPWTFVVDWVINVSKWLNDRKVTMLDPVIQLHRSLWSVRRRRGISTTVDAGSEKGVPVSFIRETAYRRDPYMVTSSSILLSGLSLKEISLAYALGFGRR